MELAAANVTEIAAGAEAAIAAFAAASDEQIAAEMAVQFGFLRRHDEALKQAAAAQRIGGFKRRATP